MSSRSVPLAPVWALLGLALLLAGCGSEGERSAEAPPSAAQPQDFPQVNGRSLAQLRREAGSEGPVLARSGSQFEPGRGRFGFALFDRTRAQIADAPAAVYVAPAGGGPAKGPFPARYESMKVKPQFQSRGASSDPDSAGSIYVSDVEFGRPGTYEVLGMVRLDGRLVSAATPAGPPLKVVRDTPVPEAGERAPRTVTPTTASVSGDVKQIDTRVPPSSMHEVSFSDTLGKKPAVLLFATPALCQSRVCGPVVDVAEEVKSQRAEDAQFIHMEIYRENDFKKGFRPQVAEWRLPSEPWLFVTDRSGRVSTAIEGAFSARELNAAIDRAQR